MKESELRKIIKEEIKNILNEKAKSYARSVKNAEVLDFEYTIPIKFTGLIDVFTNTSYNYDIRLNFDAMEVSNHIGEALADALNKDKRLKKFNYTKLQNIGSGGSSIRVPTDYDDSKRRKK